MWSVAMTVKDAVPAGHSFAAEGMTGTAAGAVMRRVRSLAAEAPAGRAFDAIATLAEITRRIEKSLVASDEALAAGDEDSASLEWARAVVLMDRLTSEAGHDGPGKGEPAYLRRRVPSES
jgi:hypothetical protein